ncbi:hypothetical protein GTA08_BOTSDO08117 [Neofusicoccum parvum]|uniref:Uncharacterized protein n=1 Tax=Botryosphaeria parva (strain UCR-NP2) TaxID=1287680 RepID=R1EM49_BOTPV|nr:hypothetical protein UCRNP2_4373 [Neofusicoccum parvum UCRNP2]GME58972.1 hypothetical protein GTA08_BOTSDO08117 [Neofusicoccum parvum]
MHPAGHVPETLSSAARHAQLPSSAVKTAFTHGRLSVDLHKPPASALQPQPRAQVERIVLELFDGQKLAWMMIAEPLQRLYELDVSSAVVLGILQDHGRVKKTVWWD